MCANALIWIAIGLNAGNTGAYILGGAVPTSCFLYIEKTKFEMKEKILSLLENIEAKNKPTAEVE